MGGGGPRPDPLLAECRANKPIDHEGQFKVTSSPILEYMSACGRKQEDPGRTHADTTLVTRGFKSETFLLLGSVHC